MNLFEQQKERVEANLRRVYGENELLKAQKANIGEIREWSGKKYQKQTNGDWKPVGDNQFKKGEIFVMKDLEFGTIKNVKYSGFFNKNGSISHKFIDIKTNKPFNLHPSHLKDYDFKRI